MLRNYRRHQVFALSAVETSSLYFFTAQGAGYNLYGKDLDRRINALEADWNVRSLSSAEKRKLMTDESWKIIRRSWPAVIKQAVNGFIRTCVGTSRETLFVSIASDGSGISSFWHTVLPLMQIGSMWLLAIVGAAAVWRTGLAPLIV